MLCNANLYAAFIEGTATKDERRIVMKRMLRDSRLILRLNMAAAITNQTRGVKK